MNKTEHLLTCLIEECSEIQHAASKALRFGLLDGEPNGSTTNKEDIEAELSDLLSVVKMLQKDDVLGNIEPRYEKERKIEKFMEYAWNRGRLDEL